MTMITLLFAHITRFCLHLAQYKQLITIPTSQKSYNLKSMSSPGNGKFIIVPAQNPNPPAVGIGPCDDCTVKPVISRWDGTEVNSAPTLAFWANPVF
ncbi:hypothetical protein BS17DRAFT_52654 [Gyrodon lividus]|nr:hypothetical protein BS17DRAFT_52654 [Gyrodon lividus]